ncbi:AAA family ATPase [Endozoicomonas sp. SM1973]|uniref:AAA family ATPase n=1 Tax=Spartinivicinus marinus TaxID=2994442 RepID=A0A853IEA9_9GAMM|nr:AAA family ATPase [Spartinivicinus marinus]MCX4025687.1 AAA family ATPase [Spartinivicinus marinus]NYZ68291.1 AAA family ATPase [Spartinivicinus marinus]
MNKASGSHYVMSDELVNSGEVEHCWLVGPFPEHQPFCDYLFYFAYHFANNVHVVVKSITEKQKVSQRYPFAHIHLGARVSFSAVVVSETGRVKANQFFIVFKDADWVMAKSVGMTPLPIEKMLVNAELLQTVAFQPSSISANSLTQKPVKPRQYLPVSHNKVAIMGPESAGKSTLALALAQQLKLPLVNEYARLWLSYQDDVGGYEDIALIAKVQQAFEQTVSAQSEIALFDTGPMTTQVWSQMLFGKVPEWLVKQVQQDCYALVLLVAPDIPWHFDPQRCQPALETRERFFQLCETLLGQLAISYQVISGADRFEQAKQALITKFSCISC